MRLLKGGVAHVATVIEDDLNERTTGLHKPHISALANICASALTIRNANTEWISVIPRASDKKSKERYISRFLSNKLIEPNSVMNGFIPGLIEMCTSNGKTAILMLDQILISVIYDQGLTCSPCQSIEITDSIFAIPQLLCNSLSKVAIFASSRKASSK